MKNILSCCLFIFIISTLSAQNTVSKSDNIVVTQGKKLYLHQVLQGQTLYAISRAYGVSVKNILKENNTTNLKLKVGEILRIPAVETKYQNQSDFYWHKVVAGETLYSVAKRYDVSVNDIAKHNRDAINGLNVGQVLKIPNVKKYQAGFEDENFYYHAVSTGETLFSIAQSYGTSLNQLYKFNPSTRAGLRAGKTLVIPKGNFDFTERLPIVHKNFPEIRNYEYDPLYFEEEGTIPCNSYKYKKDNVFSVALLLPMNIDKNNWKMSKYTNKKDKLFYENTQKFIEFYEGFILALQKLKADGLSINLYVYDTENDKKKVEQILQKPEIKKVDLLIGPVYSKNVKIVAKYAKKHKINLVTPLTQNLNLLKNNPFVFEVTPSEETRAKKVSDYLTHIYDSSVVIIHNGTKKEEELIDIYKRKLVHSFSVRQDLNEVVFKNVNYSQGGSAYLEDALSIGLDNVILIPSDNEVFVTKVIEKLHTFTKNYKITVIGNPDWDTFESIDINQLKDLSVGYATPYSTEYENWRVKRFISNYRKIYQTEPSIFSFQGYDVAYYFCSALKKYGKHFQFCLSPFDTNPNPKGLIYQFDFVRFGSQNGFENNGVKIVQYNQELKLKPLK